MLSVTQSLRQQVSQAPTSSTLAAWDARPDVAAQQAINRLDLSHKGWRGFDEVTWVKEVKGEYPQAPKLASSCSSHEPAYEQEAHDLFSQAPACDRKRLQDYFVGKLGLEELSCRLSGAGARACDKRTAFMRIHQI